MQHKQYLQDLLNQWVKELVANRKILKQQLFSLKMEHATVGVKKNSDLKSIRRNIARINTVLSHKIKTLYGSSR